MDVPWAELQQIVTNALRSPPSTGFSHVLTAEPGQRLFVASGLGLTAALFGAQLAEDRLGVAASACTPLGLHEKSLRNALVVVVSAEGENEDAIVAARHAVRCGAKLAVITARRTSKLLDLVELMGGTSHIVDVSTRGFVPDQWLLAASAFWAGLFHETTSIQLSPPQVEGDIASILAQSRLVILGGGRASIAAAYLDTACHELGLVSPQWTDPRNFAHGRHVGLARNAASSALVGLACGEREAREIARTLDGIPSSIPRLIGFAQASTDGAISLLAWTLTLVRHLAKSHGIDATKPQVSDWGRTLYSLGPHSSSQRSGAPLAATCKAGRSRGLGVDQYRRCFEPWFREFRQLRIGGFVFDYDGTLCDIAHRYTGLPNEIVLLLRRFLNHGIRIGIATGRGDSVRRVLIEAFPERAGQIWVGYHNGCTVQPVSLPFSEGESGARLKDLAAHLSRDPVLSKQSAIRVGSSQVTLRATTQWARPRLHDLTSAVLAAHNFPDMQVLRSTHTIDVVPHENDKTIVVEWLKAEVVPGTHILSVGDRGDIGGNDFTLLSRRWSVSVEESSPSCEGGWRLTEAIGVRGTVELLKRFSLRSTGIVSYDGT